MAWTALLSPLGTPMQPSLAAGATSENLHITSHSAPLSEADLQRTPHPAPSQPPVLGPTGRKQKGRFRTPLQDCRRSLVGTPHPSSARSSPRRTGWPFLIKYGESTLPKASVLVDPLPQEHGKGAAGPEETSSQAQPTHGRDSLTDNREWHGGRRVPSGRRGTRGTPRQHRVHPLLSSTPDGEK